MVGYSDLRDWLGRVAELGELSTYQGADLTEEVGRIAEVSASTYPGRAVLLGGFKGHAPGFRILLNPYGSIKRMALTFGAPTDVDHYGLLEYFKQRLEELPLIPYKEVDNGPILQNTLRGEEVDLLRFPVPKWHLGDGGPYIGTGCLIITRDPEEGWVNVGTYRMQLHDAKTVGFYVSPGHHGRIHRDKYFAKGEPCPVVAVFGSDPLLLAGSMTEVPWGVCELDWVGGWRREPVEVIRGPLTGLPIPAGAEIAIEGFSYPDRLKQEGPFGEWTGYYASGARMEPYVEVQAVYFRDDPVLVGMPPERPPYDADKCRQYIKSAFLTQQLKKQGIPGIVNAWCYGLGGCRLLVAVAIKQQYCGHSRQVGHAVYTSTAANYAGRYVVVVDEDIDPTDLEDVAWAVLTRSDPETSIDFVSRATSCPLDPRILPEDRERGKLFNSRAIIDATKPYEWRERFPEVVRPHPAYRRESFERYGNLVRL